MLTAWLVNNVPYLVQLATLPFDRATHERYFATIGWIVFREDWYPESCFEVHFQDVRRKLIAIYEDHEESENCLGIGLCAHAVFPTADDYYLTTDEKFDSAFHSTLDAIMPLFRNTATTGTYGSPFGPSTYKYAYWSFPETFMTLVQHFEGDGQCGHFASLDIRIVPRLGSARLVFPLETNMLF